MMETLWIVTFMYVVCIYYMKCDEKDTDSADTHQKNPCQIIYFTEINALEFLLYGLLFNNYNGIWRV